MLRPAALATALALLAACQGEGEPPVEARPNLLLITVDTLRADRLACYGGEADVGTAICAIADGGVRFEWAFAPAPYTAPSVASILTSLYPSQHGVTQSAVSFLEEEVVTVAEVLREAGYSTAAFVSNPVLDRNRSIGQGFDVYDQRMTKRERNRRSFEEREAQTTTDAAVAWAQIALEPPYFLWVHFQDPHGPYEPPRPEPVRDAAGQEPLPVLKNQSGRGGIPAYQRLPGVFTPAAYESRYLEEIRYLDPHVARLLDRLDALAEPPAVLLTSDHGEAFGEDGYYFAHGHSVGLDQIRVPLLWRPPGESDRARAPGRLESRPVGLVDVAPTLLATAGLPIPAAFVGRPLPVGPEAGDPATADPNPVFAEHSHRKAVILGPLYYARDVAALGEGVSDRLTGGDLLPLPPRTARLDAGGEAPAYTPVEDDAENGPADALEPVLAEFLAAGRARGAERRETVSEETRQRLEALGYMD